MSKSKINLDFYCYKCDSYFVLRDIKNPSCAFCLDSFVVSSKEHNKLESEEDELDYLDDDYYKVRKYTKSRNETYIPKQSTNYKNNLINLGNKVFFSQTSNMNRLFQSREFSDSSFKSVSNQQMDSLPTVETPTSISCSICFMEFSEGIEMVKSLYCGHQFHKTCLKSWLSQKLECPTCRHLVSFQMNSNKRSFSSVVIDGTRSTNHNETYLLNTSTELDTKDK